MNDLDDTGIKLQFAPRSECRVLVVEDDVLVRAKLISLLKLAGYDVRGAGCGAQALRLIDQRPCHIVITDCHMPEMDGLGLCRALRLRDGEHYTYVLMLSARSESTDVLKGLSAGADDYLAKSASPEEFLARVEVGRRITRLEDSLRVSATENRRLAVTDALTGARNRRYLMKYLPRELERARRYGRPLAVLSCDIDGFKRINDVYGHEAGDNVLQAFVTRSTNCLRESIDWIARTGGEEFAVVLPETALLGARCAAEKLRACLSADPIPTCAGNLVATVSVGVTALESSQELTSISVVELLRAADLCLYASKNLGKDRVTCVPPALTASIASSVPTGRKHEIN